MAHDIHENSLLVQLFIDLGKLKENKAQREDETKVSQSKFVSIAFFFFLFCNILRSFSIKSCTPTFIVADIRMFG